MFTMVASRTTISWAMPMKASAFQRCGSGAGVVVPAGAEDMKNSASRRGGSGGAPWGVDRLTPSREPARRPPRQDPSLHVLAGHPTAAATLDQPACSASTSRRTRAGSSPSGGPAGSAAPSREPGWSAEVVANSCVQSAGGSPSTANNSNVRPFAVSLSRLRTRTSASWPRPTAPDPRSPWPRTSRSSPGPVMSNQPGRTIGEGRPEAGASRVAPGAVNADPAGRDDGVGRAGGGAQPLRAALPVHQALVGACVRAGHVDRGHQHDPRTSASQGAQHVGDAAVVDLLVRADGRPVSEDDSVDVPDGSGEAVRVLEVTGHHLHVGQEVACSIDVSGQRTDGESVPARGGDDVAADRAGRADDEDAARSDVAHGWASVVSLGHHRDNAVLLARGRTCRSVY